MASGTPVISKQEPPGHTENVLGAQNSVATATTIPAGLKRFVDLVTESEGIRRGIKKATDRVAELDEER
jgi:hypothetical protein